MHLSRILPVILVALAHAAVSPVSAINNIRLTVVYPFGVVFSLCGSGTLSRLGFSFIVSLNTILISMLLNISSIRSKKSDLILNDEEERELFTLWNIIAAIISVPLIVFFVSAIGRYYEIDWKVAVIFAFIISFLFCCVSTLLIIPMFIFSIALWVVLGGIYSASISLLYYFNVFRVIFLGIIFGRLQKIISPPKSYFVAGFGEIKESFNPTPALGVERAGVPTVLFWMKGNEDPAYQGVKISLTLPEFPHAAKGLRRVLKSFFVISVITVIFLISTGLIKIGILNDIVNSTLDKLDKISNILKFQTLNWLQW